MSPLRAHSSVPIVVALLFVALIGCSNDPPLGPALDPLAGLAEVARGDSTATPPSAPTTPGYFMGTVLGYTEGPDTLGTAVKLAGVRVTAYVRAESSGRVVAGQEAGSVTTSVEGVFQLPTLPGGEYVITFVPGAGSEFGGGWTTARAWSGSGDSPWTIFLRRRD